MEARQGLNMNFDRYCGMASAVGILLILTLCVWLGASGPVGSDWILRWQSLIGAIITAAGIGLASWNVTRQMRNNARDKEFERIEGDMPGMNAAHVFLSRFTWQLGVVGTRRTVLNTLDGLGQKAIGPEVLAEVEVILPAAKDHLRREIADEIILLRASIKAIDDGEVFHRESLANLKQAELHDIALMDVAHALVVLSHEHAVTTLREYAERCQHFRDYHEELKRGILRGRARLGQLRKDREQLLRLRY
jgi:hypothetical protein